MVILSQYRAANQSIAPKEFHLADVTKPAISDVSPTPQQLIRFSLQRFLDSKHRRNSYNIDDGTTHLVAIMGTEKLQFVDPNINLSDALKVVHPIHLIGYNWSSKDPRKAMQVGSDAVFTADVHVNKVHKQYHH